VPRKPPADVFSGFLRRSRQFVSREHAGVEAALAYASPRDVTRTWTRVGAGRTDRCTGAAGAGQGRPETSSRPSKIKKGEPPAVSAPPGREAGGNVSLASVASMCLTTSFLGALGCTVPGKDQEGDPGLGSAGEVVHQDAAGSCIFAAPGSAEQGPSGRPGTRRSATVRLASSAGVLSRALCRRGLPGPRGARDLLDGSQVAALGFGSSR